MKSPFFSLIGIILLTSLLACSKPATITFYVEGACEACQEVIEQELEKMEGVVTAKWDYETSLVTLAFQTEKVSEDDIQAYIAVKGFATQFYPPNETARKDLPACCQESISRKLKRQELEIPHH